MGTPHYRGPVIPAPGEDILETLATMMDTAGIITPATSIPTARSLLTQAAAGGATITTARPMYFDIGGIVYRADGSKTSEVWALAPVNQAETIVETYIGSGSITRTPGSQHALIESSLPVRPYDRSVMVTGMANAGVSGTVGLCVLIRNTAGATSRWQSGAGQETATAVNAGIIPAGVDPQIILALSFGGSSNSTVTVSSSADANRLIVQAQPVTMA